MPMYEYVCQSCGHRFEAWQKMTDDPLEICPVCGQHIRRVLYPVGLVFKGAGFYSIDNRGTSAAASNGHSPAASAEGTESESKSKSGDTNTTNGAAETKSNKAKTSAESVSKPTAAAAGE